VKVTVVACFKVVYENFSVAIEKIHEANGAVIGIRLDNAPRPTFSEYVIGQ
jgi:hypothetical protein